MQILALSPAADILIQQLRKLFQQMPGPRSGVNSRYGFDGIGMASFSMFFMQSPSFLDRHQRFREARNRTLTTPAG